MSYHIPKLELAHSKMPRPLTVDFCFRIEEDIKKSRFITSLGHANSKEGAKAFIESIRYEFPDATHNCFAYALCAPKDTAKIGQSDDGEPHGTAGKPMLNMLLHGDIGECVVVVTRYFGGIKLGPGGLVRAYQGAVSKVLLEVESILKISYFSFSLICDYEHINKIHYLIPQYQARIIQENFAERIEYRFTLPEGEYPRFKKALNDASNGQITFL